MAQPTPQTEGNKPPRKPRGKAVRWSAADFDRMSRITGEDVAAARAMFRRLAPKSVKRLLGQ